MKKTLSLALRNILRNRRRSIATLLAMLVGVLTVLLFGGYSRDISYTLETGYVQRGGHLQIQRKDYFLFGSGNPGKYGITRYQEIMARINNDPVLGNMVTVTTPILQLSGVAGNFANGVSRTVLAFGMEVDGQNRLHEWNSYNTFQRPQQSALTGSTPDAAILGIGVARVLQLCESLKVDNCPKPPLEEMSQQMLPADIAAIADAEAHVARPGHETHIDLLAANANGAPNVSDLKVVQAKVQGTKELDDVYVAMHLEQAQRLLYGRELPKVTAIVVQLRHTADLVPARARLQTLITESGFTASNEPLELREFSEIYPFFHQALAMFKTIFGFIAILIGAIVLFTVSNTMSTAVVERTVEIGTLRAMGERRVGIRQLFVVEGMLLGLLGALSGVVAALLISGAINHSAVTWVPPGWANPVPFVVRVWGEWQLIVAVALGVQLVAILSAWWPSRRAAKLNIVEALRYV